MKKLLTRKVLIVTVIVSVVLLAVLFWPNFVTKRISEIPLVSSIKKSQLDDKRPEDQPLVVSVARELEIPWAMDFLPDGSIIFTERPGRVRLIDINKGLVSEPLIIIDEVSHIGEGGLLGVAVHPHFSENGFVYFYCTYEYKGGLANKVVRYQMRGKTLKNKNIIIDRIPGAAIHNGGRIKFGPDQFLYITTGDAAQPQLAQEKDSLAGKILRITDKGRIPADNPFPDSPVYSFGHRNPQGLAWDDKGKLWATEHGQSATDEVNLIRSGRNYGWPVIRGDEKVIGLENPFIHSGKETWAPSGAAFWKDSLFFVGLRDQTLFELKISNNKTSLLRHLQKSLGRLRDIVVTPDGFLYVLTSNRDGRGFPTQNDDQIVRINPNKL